jgi:hypothetical protein
MVILIDLPQDITDFQMCGVVVRKVLSTAVDGYAAVRTFVFDVRGRHSSGLRRFGVVR